MIESLYFITFAHTPYQFISTLQILQNTIYRYTTICSEIFLRILLFMGTLAPIIL